MQAREDLHMESWESLYRGLVGLVADSYPYFIFYTYVIYNNNNKRNNKTCIGQIHRLNWSCTCITHITQTLSPLVSHPDLSTIRAAGRNGRLVWHRGWQDGKIGKRWISGLRVASSNVGHRKTSEFVWCKNI